MATPLPPEASGPAAGGGRRRNRRWLLVIAATPLLVAGVAAVVSASGPSEPSVPLRPPAGYQAITDAYWAYAIPSGWRQDAAYTDSNGDFFYRGVGGWVGETLDIRSDPPTAYEHPPITLSSFGQIRPTPYSLTDAAPVQVAGADVAWSYTLVRSHVLDHVVDAWLRGSRTEIWLLIQAGGAVTTTVASSLRA